MISVHFQEKAFNITQVYASIRGFPHSSVSKVSACNAGNLGLIPGLGRSPGEGHGNLLQDSCLENPMGRGAWQATVPGVARVGHDLVIKLPQPPCLNHWYWRNWNWPVLWRVKTPSRTNTKKKKCSFHYSGLECKSRKSRDTQNNRQLCPRVQNEAGQRLTEFC